MTVSATSLTSSTVTAGESPDQDFSTESITAPANSLLAFWIAAGAEPTVTGLDLTWTVTGSATTYFGAIFLVTAEVGASEVSGEVSVTLGQSAVAYDLDCVSGDDGESLQFGTSAGGVVSASAGGGNTASLIISPGQPYLYLFGSSVGWEDGANGASPGEDPAWTQLALEGLSYGVYLETQVSPDGTNPNAVANWSNAYAGWGALGIAVSAA